VTLHAAVGAAIGAAVGVPEGLAEGAAVGLDKRRPPLLERRKEDEEVSKDNCPGDVTTSSSTQPLLLATDPTGSHVSTDSCPGDVTTSSRTQPLLLLATGPTGSHGQFQVKRRHQEQQQGMTLNSNSA
jgi:hypothetical protein